MSLVPSGDYRPTRQSRAKYSELARIDDQTDVAIARLNQTGDIQVAKVHAVCHVGRQALQAVAVLSQTEQQLAQLVPMATSRLQAVADTAAFAIAEVVMDTTRRLR